MQSLFRLMIYVAMLAMTASCSDVAFKGSKNNGKGNSCTTNCPPGTYTWFQSGYGLCSVPCGGGSQSQTVECRRSSDNVVVADSLCPQPKPDSVRTCNTQACSSTYAWNIGSWGECSKTCGSGIRTRQAICQNQTGSTVADSNCPQPKPATQETCNTDPCPVVTYSWQVTPGACVCQPQGGGTATNTVVCKRNDGTTVADSFCAQTKPETTRQCSQTECPPQVTYMWEPQAWGACSKTCGGGIRTRTVACKRSDGQYVAESFCPAGTKPATQEACNTQTCPPTGRQVTQTAYVTPASNSVDVILIIDDSSSMKEDQTKLAARMAGMLTELDAQNIDYQVCLTTTDISYYKGSPIRWKGPETFVMNKSTPNKDTVFRQTIDSLGAEWSSDEQGIKAMYLMIRDFRNAGCLRPQATLSTILVSDENERSVGGNRSWSEAQYQPLTNENYPDTLLSYVSSTFNTSTFTKPFIWNSIIVKPGDTTCEAHQDAQSSPSFFGTLYAELSQKTNGHIGSICDNDYSQNLRYIRERTVNNMPGLTMECVPTNTPKVTFDRAVSTTITMTGNQIKFSPAIPENVRITAVYTCPN